MKVLAKPEVLELAVAELFNDEPAEPLAVPEFETPISPGLRAAMVEPKVEVAADNTFAVLAMPATSTLLETLAEALSLVAPSVLALPPVVTKLPLITPVPAPGVPAFGWPVTLPVSWKEPIDWVNLVPTARSIFDVESTL